MADKELKLKITQKVDTGPVRELQTEMRKLGIEQARLYQEGKKDTSSFKENQAEINKLKNSIKELQGVMKGFSGKTPLSGFQLLETLENITVVTAGLRYATQQAISFGKELFVISKQAADTKVLYDGFVKVAGSIEQADIQLESMRKASTGNLPDEELIKFANGMNSMGYSAKTTTQILDIAEKQGDKVGVTFENANSSLQKFITTGSGKGLNELKINIALVHEEMERLTGKTMKQIGEMDELTQQTIRTNAVVNLFGDSLENISKKIGDNADRLNSLSTKYDNLKLIIGAGLAAAFVRLASGIDTSSNSLGKSIAQAEYYAGQIANIVLLIKSITGGDEKGTLENSLRIVADKLNYENSLDPSKKPYGPELPPGGILPLNNNFTGSSSNSGGKTKDIKEITNEVIELTKRIEDLQAKLNISTPGTSQFQYYIDQINELRRQIKELESTSLLGKIISQPGEVKDTTGSSISPITNDPFELSLSLSAENQRKEAERLEKIKNTFDGVLSTSQQITNLFGNATASRLVQDFSSIYSLANSILSVLSFFGIGGGGGLLSLFGGIFGGGGGGASRANRPLGLSGGRGTMTINLTGNSSLRGTDIVQSFRKTIKVEGDLGQF